MNLWAEVKVLLFLLRLLMNPVYLLLLPSIVKRKLESRRGRSVSPTQSCDPAADIFQPYYYEREAFGARLGLWKNSFLGKIANQKVYKKKFITVAGYLLGKCFQIWTKSDLGLFFLSFFFVFNWLGLLKNPHQISGF